MAQITIEVPDALVARLSAAQARLPEVLARGLNELSPVPNQVYRYILEFLGRQPSAEEIILFGPTPAMVTRTHELLEKHRDHGLSRVEEQELDEYVRIDHQITMIKAAALALTKAR